MGLSVGIVGLPNIGKSALCDTLSSAAATHVVFEQGLRRSDGAELVTLGSEQAAPGARGEAKGEIAS